MNRRIVAAIARKDLRVVWRSRALIVPLVAVPIVLLVFVPLGLALVPLLVADDPSSRADLLEMIASLPGPARRPFAGLPAEDAWIAIVHTQLWPPLFLLVPFMVANVIAADSFAGERERGTLEALLYTPATDRELFVGKTVAALLPAMGAAVLGVGVYAVIGNLLTWAMLGHGAFVPDLLWLVLVVWMSPAVATLGLAGMVIVSLRVRSTQEAIQMGGLLVIPLIALLVGQLRGVLLFGPVALLVVGALVWLVNVLLLRWGVRRFRRTRLMIG